MYCKILDEYRKKKKKKIYEITGSLYSMFLSITDFVIKSHIFRGDTFFHLEVSHIDKIRFALTSASPS